jgi:predicted ATPase
MTGTLPFSALLRYLRKRAGMTQRDLAAALNYSDSLISSLEHAQRRPDLHTVTTRFISALGLQDDPTAARLLIEQATLACGEHPGDLITLQPPTHAMTQDERETCAAQLPSSPNELIGRTEEVQQLCNRLRGHNGRLLTLVGPPGIGKTRLALAVAARIHRHYPDGTVFVPLAAITDPAVMASTIAVAVGGDDASAKPPTMRLIESLRHKSMLLVLDNCEQIIGAAPLVAEVVAACPGLCMLATSRERLHLRAEQRYRVPPLDLAAAVDLFAQRAAAIDADFAVTGANHSTIEAICQRLDRLPLAIELCAAQVDLLAPSQILAHLHMRPLDLLVDGARDLPPQQRTLRNAIQRSYDLLSDDERTLFRRLGVFVGGCDLAAVETVCAWQANMPTHALLATLHGLVGKSLVRAEPTPTGESRFLLLETIREFALEQLRAQGEEYVLRERHYAAYLEFARTANRYIRSPESASWLARLQPEQDNIRAALHWTLDEQRYADMAWLIIAVCWFWHTDTWYETSTWIAQLLPHRMTLDIDLRLALMIRLFYVEWIPEAFQPLERWKAEVLELLDACPNMHLHAAAWHPIALTYYTTDYPRAVAGWERGIACARAAGDAPEVDVRRFCLLIDHRFALAYMLWAYANALVNQGEFEQALPMLLESRDIFQQRGSRYELSISLGTLGMLALLQGDLARAYAQLQEAVTFATEFNNQWMIGFWQPVLGFVTLHTGDVAGARRILTASLRLCTELKDPMLLARNMTFLAETAIWEGQTDEAADWLAKSLAQEADPGIIIIYEVIRLFVAARVATAQGQYQRAALLFGLAEQANSQIHHAYAGPLRIQTDVALVTVRAVLDPAVFAEAFAAGQQLSLDEAFATVLHPTTVAAER